MNPLHYVVFHTSYNVEVWQCLALIAWAMCCEVIGEVIKRHRRKKW